MSKTLLIIGAGIEQVPGIKLAKKMGLYVIVTDGNPKAPGFKYSDNYAVISTYDVKKTLQFAIKLNKKRKINGVMTLASDVPLTVSTIADKLGLPGNSIKTAELASNKLLMKRKFLEKGIPSPIFSEVKNVNDIKKFIRKYRYPVVLKPIDSRGARGVLKLTNSDNLNRAFNKSKNESSSKRVIIEEFLKGPQFSTESIISDGNIITPGISNRNYEYLKKFSPYIIENGGDLPAKLNKKQRKEIDRVLMKAAIALGIEKNSIKGDVVYTNSGPKIIEIAARLSGGWFCTDQIIFSTGVNMVKAVINISLGIAPDFSKLAPKYNKGVAIRYFFPSKGKIIKISGLDKVKKLKNIKKVGINIKVGSYIDRINDHTKRAGFVITQARNRKSAINAAEKAISLIKVKLVKKIKV